MLEKYINIYEIHCMNIQELYRNYTNRLIKVNDNTYIYPTIDNLSPKLNDKMICICRKKKKNIYEIYSFFNITNGTKSIQNKLLKIFFNILYIIIIPYAFIVLYVLSVSKVINQEITEILVFVWIGTIIWLIIKSFLDYICHRKALKTILNIDNLQDITKIKQFFSNHQNFFISDDF